MNMIIGPRATLGRAGRLYGFSFEVYRLTLTQS